MNPKKSAVKDEKTLKMHRTIVRDYRNVMRSFLFNKALTKVSRKRGKLLRSEVDSLMAFCCLGGEHYPVSLSRVITMMKHCNKSPKAQWFYSTAESLESRGFLISADGRFKRYRLSVEGINWMKLFEATLREEHWSR